jgi:hypothetical protein
VAAQKNELDARFSFPDRRHFIIYSKVNPGVGRFLLPISSRQIDESISIAEFDFYVHGP